MIDLYIFITGPLAWAAFILFVGGSLYRLVAILMLARKKERFVFSYMSFKYGLRSILHWITPFATENMRKHPILTIATFAFHICLILTPILLLAHVILWDESWNLSWWSLPDGVADFMTIVVILSCIFFFVRRLITPEVQFVTSASDYVIMAIVAAPFVTGFLAYHQWFAYRFFMVFHILAGEIMLVAIPFTRLSHMIYSPFRRAYMGSEFGAVRHAKDW